MLIKIIMTWTLFLFSSMAAAGLFGGGPPPGDTSDSSTGISAQPSVTVNYPTFNETTGKISDPKIITAPASSLSDVSEIKELEDNIIDLRSKINATNKGLREAKYNRDANKIAELNRTIDSFRSELAHLSDLRKEAFKNRKREQNDTWYLAPKQWLNENAAEFTCGKNEKPAFNILKIGALLGCINSRGQLTKTAKTMMGHVVTETYYKRDSSGKIEKFEYQVGNDGRIVTFKKASDTMAAESVVEVTNENGLVQRCENYHVPKNNKAVTRKAEERTKSREKSERGTAVQ